MVAIYVLVDPRSKEIRYVGQSNTPHSRRTEHVTRGDSHGMYDWRMELKEENLQAEMYVIDEVTKIEADDKELYYINHYLSLGTNLINEPKPGRRRKGKFKYSIEAMNEIAKLYGGKCVSNSFKGSHSKLAWVCANNHTWEALPSSIFAGHWCRCGKCLSASRQRTKEEKKHLQERILEIRKQKWP